MVNLFKSESKKPEGVAKPAEQKKEVQQNTQPETQQPLQVKQQQAQISRGENAIKATHQTQTTQKFYEFFVKATTAALQQQPIVNAVIDGKEIVYKNYIDISVAVATPTGLMVPVLRNTETMNFVQIEKELIRLGNKGKEGKIQVEDMAGGTFTISNGGVFGSLMGTPIINPPQSAILGMHSIVNRPIVKNDQIVARPMMYLALTYDHRLIDGREAVTFLKTIKDEIEDPRRLLLDL
ncbi:hypothetical protein IMG5_098920 [Ichthyophthirius multifiliis]|uniref:dihydrolipoyllysine-residue succinyltransferase n=1 Tax=Ichthyophthirius multifiliis TaxID=5932 RepID=G0QS26_ICHMU|nr:hypothetical protein IMG5_098920 [Ichthyophthirius multifiliis]EGR31968.1 hypothetical protein IMG5_098920 [Ichthyophthirius multifiliis]|eukprot:XP_004035454.1 hypothetical protein IMG5_098920 [Ichthyophthirius multifiliis]